MPILCTTIHNKKHYKLKKCRSDEVVYCLWYVIAEVKEIFVTSVSAIVVGSLVGYFLK